MRCTLHLSGAFWLVIVEAPGLWFDGAYGTHEEALATLDEVIKDYKENN